MTRKIHPPPTVQALQGDLDLFSIQAQWEALGPLAAGLQGTLSLDLSGIGDLDLSGLQLLLALDRQLKAQGGGLSLTGIKPEWVERFRPLGFAPLLEVRP